MIIVQLRKLIGIVLIALISGVPNMSWALSTDQQEIFDKAYTRALRAAEIRSMTGHSFDPSFSFRVSEFSAEELGEAGFWFLENASGPDDIEKAVWILEGARKKGLEVEPETKWHIGYFAYQSSLRYADPQSEDYDIMRAYILSQRAGFQGIQQGFLAAGYYHRLLDSSRRTEHPASYIKHEQNLFWRASLCTRENVSRNFMPYETALCDIASREEADAKRRVNAAYRSSSGSGDEMMWLVMAAIGLAALAISSGASGSDDEFALQQQAYEREEAARKQALLNTYDAGMFTAGQR